MLRLLSAAVLACGIAGVFAARPDQVKAADATEWCKISIASGVKQGKGGDFNLFLLGNAQGVSVLRYVTYCDVWDADGNWYTVRTGDNPPDLGGVFTTRPERVTCVHCKVEFLTDDSDGDGDE